MLRGLVVGTALAAIGGCIAQQDLGERPSDRTVGSEPGRKPGDVAFGPTRAPGSTDPLPPRPAPFPQCECSVGSELMGDAPQLADHFEQSGYRCAPPVAPTSSPPSCEPELTECNGACVDTAADPLNCGACGARCPTPGKGVMACVDGRCTSCGQGYRQCIGDGATGTCVDIDTDLDHCGACGVICDAGCVAGTCQPPSEFLVSDSVVGDDFVFDDSYVYFGSTVDGGGIARVHLAGGPTELVVPGAAPSRLAVDDGFLYWTDEAGGAIRRANKAGGTPELVGAASLPWGIAVDDLYVYWAEQGDSSTPPWSNSLVRRVQKSGAPPETLVALQGEVARELIVDDIHVYFTHLFSAAPVDGNLSRVLKWGGPAELFSSAGAGHIAMDATEVWGISGALADGAVEVSDKTGASAVHRLVGLTDTGGERIAVSDAYVYFDGYRIPRCGGRIARFVPEVSRMRANDGYLYWTFLSPGAAEGALFRRVE
jgi:hypothetical protein